MPGLTQNAHHDTESFPLNNQKIASFSEKLYSRAEVTYFE